jgi:hypothetical protein
MSIRNLPDGKEGPARKADLTAICESIVWRKCGILDVCMLLIPFQTSEFNHTAGKTTNGRGSDCMNILHSHDCIARSAHTMKSVGSTPPLRELARVTIPVDKQWEHLKVCFDTHYSIYMPLWG